MTNEKSEKKINPYLFKKGQSGNPKGRPKKGNSFGDILSKELLRQKREMEFNGEQRIVNGKELIALSLISIAFGKDSKPHEKMMAIDRIMDRIDGKAMQQVIFDGSVETKKTPSLTDMIDVNGLSEKQRKNLEDILKKEYSNES